MAALAPNRERQWNRIGLVLLALVAVLMFVTARDFGLTWDEEFHSTYGKYVLDWFQSGFTDARALSFKNSYIYGALFDVLAELFARLSPLGLYEDRHLVNVGFGILAIAGTRRLGRMLLGARGGVVAMCLATLTPMFYGHSFNNPKDIPFAALFVWTLVYVYESAQPLPAASWRATAKLTLSLGALLATRPAGIFFLAYIVVWWSLSLWRAAASQRDVHRAIGALVLVVCGGWLLMLTCWPWGQINPIIHPIAGIAMASRFSYAMTTLFFGQQIAAQHPPLSYLPTWFALQLPETYFVAAAAAVAGCAFTQRCTARANVAFLGFVVAFPILTAMMLHSTLYDAVRHFLFVIPPLAILAAAGIESGLRPSVPGPVRVLVAGLTVVAAIGTAFDMVKLHPYESVYFNRLVAGGLPGVSGRFETDYWGNSYREATEWVVANVPGDRIRVANCGNTLQTSYYLTGPEGARFIAVTKEDDPDLLLATTRWDCNRRTGARVLHKVERQGVPLAYVLDLRR